VPDPDFQRPPEISAPAFARLSLTKNADITSKAPRPTPAALVSGCAINRSVGATLISLLLVAIFHASFDGAINKLSYDIVPASDTAGF